MNISNKLSQNFIWEMMYSGRYRKTRLQITRTLSNILQPRVFIFMLSGITIIFLTFLTSNNAAEIAISGIASVFIGIGVNNFSMIEAHLKEERRTKMKTGQTAHILRVTNSMIEDLNAELSTLKDENIKSEFDKIYRFVRLGIQLIEDDEHDKLFNPL